MIVTEQSHVFECRWCVLISKVIRGLCVQHIRPLVGKHNNSLVLIKLIRPDILITDTFYRVAVKLRACTDPEGRDIGSKTFPRRGGHFFTFTENKSQVPAQAQVGGGGGIYIDWCIIHRHILINLHLLL